MATDKTLYDTIDARESAEAFHSENYSSHQSSPTPDIYDVPEDDVDEIITTGDMHKILLEQGFTVGTDQLRVIINNFEEFLHFTKTKSGKGGHIRIRKSDSKLLSIILTELKTHNTEQVRNMLSTDLGQMAACNDADLSIRLNQEVEKRLALVVKEAQQEFAETMKKVLVASQEQYSTAITALAEKQNDLIKKQEDLQRDIAALTTDYKSVIEEKERLLLENEELKQKKKKWSFFGKH